MTYDYLIVGAGLFGSIFAYEANKRGYKCLVIDKRNHIGGNCYTEVKNNIIVHTYGAHIFHTSKPVIWNYVNSLVNFTPFINSPLAFYKGELYNLPFNMNTFHQLWNVLTPTQAIEKINSQKVHYDSIVNLEQQALSLVGTDIYTKLIKGYTEKQWGRDCKDLPSFIIKRIPLRFTYDNNYFNDIYQGIPEGGYTKVFERLLDGIEVRLNQDYFQNKEEFDKIAKKIIFTGPIDQYFSYCYGPLEYRSVSFEVEELDIPSFQGNAVVNYTDGEVPYTRIIEHKFFTKVDTPTTIISKEYSTKWDLSKEPYYPVNDEVNTELYKKYLNLANAQEKVIFGGRLGQYKYYNMDQVIEESLSLVEKEF